MAAQQDVTQILDLGAAGDQQASAASAGTEAGSFNSALNRPTGSIPSGSTGFQPVASQVVTHEVALSSGGMGKSSKKTALIAIGAIFIGITALLLVGPFTVDEILGTLGFSEPEIPQPKVAPRKVVKAPDPLPTATRVGPGTPAAPKDDNVWSVIKNEMGDDLPELAAPLTADQESLLKDKLSHHFIYQQYVGVLEVSALRAKGSEELLRIALESKKFWTRMRALIGLADLGEDITDDDVKLALGDAHSELRARFFKRFEKSPCSLGCFYVTRAALSHLDELGRAQAIKVIAREKSEVRDLFMVAATYDKSDLVKSAAEEWLVYHSVELSPLYWI